MDKNKKFVIITISSTIVLLILIIIFMVIIDPYFHYHKPYAWLKYNLYNQRYQNDGIIKHFDYNAIITGTSMTENFKTSELNDLFNVNSVKVSFSGGSFKEINDNLITATNYNKNIKMIVRSIDLYKINEHKDTLSYEKDSYPTYLYDNNIINDIKYIFNKDIIVDGLNDIMLTINNRNSSNFDDYSKWYDIVTFSKETVDSLYKRESKQDIVNELSTSESQTIHDNIMQNVITLAKEYPDIDFYLFYPPYSIYYWDNLNQQGNLKKHLDIIEEATKLLVTCDNIHLYSFLDEYQIITNLNNYKDVEHYSEKINSLILKKMQNKENLLTKNNYEKHLNNIKKFYLNYDYDKLFKNS